MSLQTAEIVFDYDKAERDDLVGYKSGDMVTVKKFSLGSDVVKLTCAESEQLDSWILGVILRQQNKQEDDHE